MSHVLRVATRKGLFTVSRIDAGWSVNEAAFLGDNCSAILKHPVSGAVYVALDHGHFGVKLHRSRDGGRSFDEISVPAYPTPAGEEEPWLDMFGRSVPSALQLIWVLEAGHAEHGERLWCGTIPGGLFRSDDGGDSWALNHALWGHPSRRKWFGGGMDYPGIHSISIHPQRLGSLSVAVSCGGVWRSADDGDSWRCTGQGLRADYMPPQASNDPDVQDVHRLARCRDHPEVLWAQHHNGIFRSTDDGDSWQDLGEVAPSAFGFTVVAHPRDPQRAWFVPEIKDERRIPAEGRVVVNRAEDGGQRFRTFTHGLPQGHAYDIIYRHAMDEADDGTLLAMGSTTGSLWISEDAGQRWIGVSHHLPPIYAVRFD